MKRFALMATVTLATLGIAQAVPVTYQISGRNALTDFTFPESHPFSDFPGLTNPARFNGTISLDPETFHIEQYGEVIVPMMSMAFSASIGSYTITHRDGSIPTYFFDNVSEVWGLPGSFDILYMVQTGAEGFVFDNLRLDGDDFVVYFIDPTGTAFTHDDAIEGLDLTKFNYGEWGWFGYAINTETGEQDNVGIGGTIDRIRFHRVPDAGSTIMLLGVALSTLGIIRLATCL